MQHRTWITALNLQQWAPTGNAKLRIPQLVRRLVHATVDRTALETVEFPAGEQIYRPDYDGITKTTSGNFKVPKGLTYWEIGAGAKTKKKLDDDYKKRLDTRGDGDFKDVTYIAVTPYSYRPKKKWVKEKKAQGDWGDVRVYDSADLEEWIETSPSVGVWFSRLTGSMPEGVTDLSSRWEVLTASLRKKLPASLLLIGRELITKRFQEWLDAPPGFLHVAGHSPQEVVDVFTAWVESLPLASQTIISSRAIIVEGPDAWRALVTSVNSLILVASENLDLDETLIASANGKGHHVLIPSVTIGSRGIEIVRLPRLNRGEFGTKLVEAGLGEQEGHTLANQSGGVFSVFKRLFSSSANVRPPKWAEAGSATDIAPLMLVGAWQNDMPADQQIVSQISGKSHDDCVRTLNKWRTGSDSPVRLLAGIWEFVSPLDAWVFLHHALTSQDLDRFEKVAEEVLSSDNPAYDLPKEERWQAAIKKKVPKFSSELCAGLAQSLAVVATQPIPNDLPSSIPLPHRAYRVVEKLLGGGVSWQRWASLSRVLPVLAEAAPGAFMQAVEDDLRSANPKIPLLFEQEVSGIAGRAEHTGLLWALERLAWSDIHVTKASDLLAQLSEKDPGGKWANRPQSSLRDVFFSWMPYTTAKLDQRLNLIAGIVKNHPAVGWKLVLSLLPRASDSIGRNLPPEWNFWAEGWTPGVSTAEYAKTLTELVTLAISVLKREPSKWIDILRNIDHLPIRDKEAILCALEGVDLASFPEPLKQPFWKALRDQILRYRFHADAPWAPSADMAERLQKIQDKFEPDDIVELVLPAFTNGFGMLGVRDMPWEEQEKLRQKNRSDGLKQVLDKKGFNGVQLLAAKASDTFGVGITLSLVSDDQFLGQTIPDLLVSDDGKVALFASAYLIGLTNKNGRDWAEQLVSPKWTAEQVGAFAVNQGFDSRTWAFVKAQGSGQNEAYWKKVQPHPMGLQPEQVAEAARHLIEAKRSPSAISLLSSSTYQKNAPATKTLFDLFESTIFTSSGPNEKLEDPHDIHAILGAIYSAPKKVDESRLAKIEWNLLPILDRHTMLPQGLHRLLLREPKFFVELLTLLFRNENEPETEVEEPEEDAEINDAQKRQNAWHLLHDFATVPGGDDEGKVDLGKLREWVNKARELAKTEGRLTVCDSAIGQLFANSGEAEDGTWPIIPVREIIEEIASDKLDNGFFVGVLNRRGSTWKAVTEGGKATRALADQWEKHAEASKVKWPRTASALRAVASSYRGDAAREDADAERRI